MLALTIIGADVDPISLSTDPLALAKSAFAIAGAAFEPVTLGQTGPEGHRYAPKDVETLTVILADALAALEQALDEEGNGKDGTNHFNRVQELERAIAFLHTASGQTVALEV